MNGTIKLEELRQLYSHHPRVVALSKATQTSDVRHIYIEGLHASAEALAFGALTDRQGLTMLFVKRDADEAGYFYHDLCQMMGGEQDVFFFPSSFRRAIKYAQRDAANEILRTEVLSRLAAPTGRFTYIVSYPEAMAELVVSKRKLEGSTIALKKGMIVDISETAQRLRSMGFTEVDYVYEPGQFALRGSILDVFSYSSELPFRIDLFGDEIDSLRTFEVDTQLSRQTRENIEIVPELGSEDEEKIPLLSFLPTDTWIVVSDLTFLCDAVSGIYEEGFSRQAIAERGEMRSEEQLTNGEQFVRDLLRFRTIETMATRGTRAREGSATLRFNTSAQPLFHKNFDLLRQTLSGLMAKDYKVYMLADSQKQNERLKEILSDVEIIAVDKTLHEGFYDNDLKLCLLTDHQIFDRFHKYNLRSDKARSGKVALTLKEIRQFEIGDYVVHVDHGIGRFGGLIRMPQGDGYQEMIKISYLNGDSIYVSIHALYKVSKYRSQSDGAAPKLSHLGTGQWERLKEKTKTKIKDIARDLILLYSKRKHERGFAFSPDQYMQHELEASFLYEDTPDQLRATNEVKADMEKARPMDRLVCGDVGFGKTEVAVRAAFKAACDSKQVAVLVPTTVLAYQHFQTFSKRLKDFPVRVDYMTRARTSQQTREILKDLEEGRIDIIIGTHKLIGKQVKFKDLGLLIIDEEQKFGVATKEKLRQKKATIDTLTMSATPIPRTLQFSLLGARDLSVIQTPPPNRYPIQTEIHTFGAEIIADAINFEMSRNGQVFFVNNRIGDLSHIAEIIHRHVPDARVAIGHGQMNPEELEHIMLGFSNYDYDVLLSTTIVENGLDIQNANTIIINGAHNFGLSDLHQMRGRVGRSNRKAFCYLLAPPLASLNPEARKRLEALETFSDLGSGINIAMQDLDIRGAGNLLGAEQSGFIADLGYETYQKILNEAVTELRNDEFADMYREENVGAERLSACEFVSDCALESDLEMYFPDQYVPRDSERMLLYRELDAIRDDEALAQFRTRLKDRFGEIPKVAEELILVVPLRRMGRQLGCEKIILKQGRMSLFFVSNPDSAYYQSEAFGLILAYATSNPKRCVLKESSGKRSLTLSGVGSVGKALKTLESIIGTKQQQG